MQAYSLINRSISLKVARIKVRKTLEKYVANAYFPFLQE